MVNWVQLCPFYRLENKEKAVLQMVSEGSVSNLFWAVAPGISSSRMKTQATWILKELQKFKSKPKPTLETIYGDTLFLGDHADPPPHPIPPLTQERSLLMPLFRSQVKVLESENLHLIPETFSKWDWSSVLPLRKPLCTMVKINYDEYKKPDTHGGLDEELFVLSPCWGVLGCPWIVCILGERP